MDDCYRIADFSICNVVYVICCIANLEGIANAQKLLGIGQEEKARRIRGKRDYKKGKGRRARGRGGGGG